MRECQHVYIPGTLCKGVRRPAAASLHSVSEYEGLFDFVMSHYADLVYMLRYEGLDVRCLM